MALGLQYSATAAGRYTSVKSGSVKTRSSIPAPSRLVGSHEVAEKLIGDSENGETSATIDASRGRIAAIRHNSCTFIASSGVPLGQRSLGHSGADTNAPAAGGRSGGRLATAALAAPPLSFFARAIHRALASEAQIRADLRADTHFDLKYTVRGKRGEGRTKETILDRIRWRRIWHTQSIERSRALKAELNGGGS